MQVKGIVELNNLYRVSLSTINLRQQDVSDTAESDGPQSSPQPLIELCLEILLYPEVIDAKETSNSKNGDAEHTGEINPECSTLRLRATGGEQQAKAWYDELLKISETNEKRRTAGWEVSEEELRRRSEQLMTELLGAPAQEIHVEINWEGPPQSLGLKLDDFGNHVQVAGVVPDSPARRQGNIRVGDMVAVINGKMLHQVCSVNVLIQYHLDSTC